MLAADAAPHQGAAFVCVGCSAPLAASFFPPPVIPSESASRGTRGPLTPLMRNARSEQRSHGMTSSCVRLIDGTLYWCVRVECQGRLAQR
jgi:hypothetical protein